MSTDGMIVAGVMSGTSADGINVALVRIRASKVRGRGRPRHTVELVGHAEYSYPGRVRIAVMAAMNAENARVADLARLNFVLGGLYADAVLAAERRFHISSLGEG
jgi:anhydro-N-acetylmuramic acid kinase